MLEAFVYACGGYNLLFLLFHAAFWKLFRWRKQLRKLHPANRGIMQILNLRLMYVFGVFAALCFWFPAELLTTPLGRFVLGSMAVFWLGRLVEQFVLLRLRSVLVHVLTVLFFLGAALHAVPLLLSQLGR